MENRESVIDNIMHEKVQVRNLKVSPKLFNQFSKQNDCSYKIKDKDVLRVYSNSTKFYCNYININLEIHKITFCKLIKRSFLQASHYNTENCTCNSNRSLT